MRFIYFILFCLSLSSIAHSDTPEMNGIQLLQFGDFTKNWKIASVRFRQDSKEMRLIYANSIAIEALQKGSYPFPEGSVFAKVGIKTGVDPAFNSSIVPNGTRRFQLMVKDSNKYKETDGWGYALFQSDGKLYEGDMKLETLSCHACHKLVPERNFVFSELVGFSPFESLTTPPSSGAFKHATTSTGSRLLFEILKVKQTTGSLKKTLMERKIQQLRIVSGPMRKNYFLGTLDEITPLLLEDSFTSVGVSGFVSEDQATFKLVQHQKDRPCEMANDKFFKVFEAIKTKENSFELKESELCAPLMQRPSP